MNDLQNVANSRAMCFRHKLGCDRCGAGVFFCFVRGKCLFLRCFYILFAKIYTRITEFFINFAIVNRLQRFTSTSHSLTTKTKKYYAYYTLRKDTSLQPFRQIDNTLIIASRSPFCLSPRDYETNAGRDRANHGAV